RNDEGDIHASTLCFRDGASLARPKQCCHLTRTLFPHSQRRLFQAECGNLRFATHSRARFATSNGRPRSSTRQYPLPTKTPQITRPLLRRRLKASRVLRSLTTIHFPATRDHRRLHVKNEDAP